MAEALTNNFQNLYNKYTRSENTENAALNDKREIYIAPVPTNSTDSQLQQRYRSKSHRVFSFDTKQLCQTKETKWHALKLKKVRPLTGQCCSVCIPFTVKGNAKVLSNLKNLLDIYSIGPAQNSMFGRPVDILKFFYQLKKQEYKYVYDQVLEDKSVIKAINEAARKVCTDEKVTDGSERSFVEELKTQRKNTEKILMVISANIKNFVFKFTSWFTFHMVSLLSTSLVVQSSQIDAVRNAEQSGLPVIYLPLHKSHMDYILLGLVLTVHNIKPPLVAAGENLRVFFISKLLSYLGAFYIKRQVNTKNDQLYWSILSSYIKNSLKNGHHLEFFLEGARSRSGKCCVPKGGLLSILVDAYREGAIEDAWIIPVSMNYDRILDGNFVREQLGQPKKKETFFAAISTFVKAICSHYGIMRVDFNVPYRLRDLYESVDKNTKLKNEILEKEGLEIMSESIQYKHTVDGMAKHIVYDCWKSSAIMSTNVVCFLLLKKYRNGTTSQQLALDLSLMRDQLSQADRDFAFSGNSKDVIEHTLRLISPKLVVCTKIDADYFVKPILSIPSLIELSYYGNGLLSHYLHQSIVALSLSKLVCPEFWKQEIAETSISRNELIDCVLFITDLLQFDFVFIKPCDTLDSIVDTVIRHFEEEEIVLIDMLLDEEMRSQHIATLLDSDSEDDNQRSYKEFDVEYRISANDNSLEKIKFYRSIMMPYLECMAECAGSFIGMQNNSVPEYEHVQIILEQMHENLDEGILSYGESISVDTIKHSFLAFEKFNCLKITTKDNVKILSMVDDEDHDLKTNMQNMSDYIEEFVMKIH